MTSIIDGELFYDNLTINAKGGTELMAKRLASTVDRSLLENVEIICSRPRTMSSDEGRKRIMWFHDLPEDPESHQFSDPKFVELFDAFVFVSDWQKQSYLKMYPIPHSKSIVIENGVEKFDDPMAKKFSDGKIKMIYHTTPHRGLEILVPVVDALVRKHPEIHLDVYSSFEIYGWGQRDKPYEELFEQIKSHSNMNYFGSVPNEDIRKALLSTDLFVYPSIWTETSCIAAIEAMMAGVDVVVPDLGALPGTVRGMGHLYGWVPDVNEHANIVYQAADNLISVIKNDPIKAQNRMWGQSLRAHGRYDWNIQKQVWVGLLEYIKR